MLRIQGDLVFAARSGVGWVGPFRSHVDLRLRVAGSLDVPARKAVKEGSVAYTVADFFSGAGGMSYGFHAHSDFELVGAFDAQVGKPSSPIGSLGCNATYEANVGLAPHEVDLMGLDGGDALAALASRLDGRELDVILACPPCTGLSRTNPRNHLEDDPRNSLIRRVALWVEAARPKVLVMENARELITGNFALHFLHLKADLEALGYTVDGRVHRLDQFGLPQRRERALVLATRDDFVPQTLEGLWAGYALDPDATTVRRAIGDLPHVPAGETHPGDPMHVSPALTRSSTRRRLELLPHDGGSWADLRDHAEAEYVLTPAMKRNLREGRLGSHPDVYGRMWWDRPAVTIKRECGHVGNGRYSHPEQDRLLTVREMAVLQGFPFGYRFESPSMANMYRHIGDAVPPLVSHQLAHVVHWIISGSRPSLTDTLLDATHLGVMDLIPSPVVEQGVLAL